MVSLHTISTAVLTVLLATTSIDAQLIPSSPPATTLTTAAATQSPASSLAEMLSPDKPGLVVGSCAYDCGAALARWRNECRFAIKHTCWNRAPRLDRCCDPVDLQKFLPKPYHTCKDYLPPNRQSWDNWGGSHCEFANGTVWLGD